MEEKKYCYKYPHPAVTADNVIFAFDNKDLNVLLVKRKNAPYKDCWAFPGGFMNIEETLEQCAKRELEEETGFKAQRMEQLMCFSAVGRDPRERVITVAFFALVRMRQVKGGDDALEAKWFKLKDVPNLAFDHDYILRIALNKLKERVHFEPICFELLEEPFTMTELQRLYEAILGVQFDRRNFFRKMMSWGILKRVEEKEEKNQQDFIMTDYIASSNQEDFSLDFSDLKSNESSFKPSETHLALSGLKQLLGNSSSEDIPLVSSVGEEESDIAPKKSNPRAAIRYTFDRQRYEEKKNEGFRLEF